MVQSKALLCKNFNIQPSEIERMPHWEWEYYLEECEKIAEEEKKKQEEQEKGHSMGNYQTQARRVMNGYGNGYNMSKLPSIPSVPPIPKMPKI